MAKLFGTDGIRGRANCYPITAEVALNVGKAIAHVMKPQSNGMNRVLIGKDTRLSGYMLETALTSGLVSMGMDVLLVGPLPTPAVAHLAKSMRACAGVMLTASHNPFDDNGVKIFGADGFKLSDELEAEIEEHILSGELVSDHIRSDMIGKAYRIDDAVGRYIEFAKSSVQNQNLSGLKIVVDCAHGAGYFVGPLILQELGAEVIKINTSPDGYNINNDCGALHPEHVGRLVCEHKADLGVAFDGDADRVIFCDGQGNVVDGDRVLAMCALAMKAQKTLANDTLVVTSMSNLGLHEAMRKNGIQVAVTDVGDRHVIKYMRDYGCNLGGEQSGHLIFKDFATTGDGIVSALQILKLMKDTGRTLADLADCMVTFPQEIVSLPVAEKKPLEELDILQKNLLKCSKALGDNGRVILRYSGTENKIRLLVEARDADVVEKWVSHMTGVIEEELG
jgi:phosphoglucosamine mutase